ncbi:hypothetical protein E5332_03265 [Enterorhabdus sp. NM05_H27]|nr:hypothetical protein E5332_03265 [Enterorhabdus sp. NM05_H27]
MDALVFSELADSMQVIERKFHGGQYDAQAMPLVEAFLSELHTLAQIQVERNGIIDRRIADLRRANIMAYQAVCEERARREEGIDKARMYEWHSVAASYDRREAQMRRKQAKRLQHDEERAAKIEAKAQRTREKATQKIEAKTAREARSSAAKAVRVQRREDRNAAWQKLKQRRYERRVSKEQMRAERERLKWQVRQERSEMDLDQLRVEKEAARAESAARQAALEANVEIARAQEQVARVQEEWAQQELERLGVAEAPACDALPAEEPTTEASVREAETEMQEGAAEAPTAKAYGAAAEAAPAGTEPTAADAPAVPHESEISELPSVTEKAAEAEVPSPADGSEPGTQELEIPKTIEASEDFDARSGADKQPSSLKDLLKKWVADLASDNRDK